MAVSGGIGLEKMNEQGKLKIKTLLYIIKLTKY